ncbi:hypothetical protein M885DRAFT_325481 [Pelagophyceae sp. CCMP2097]|nr:hypothetical protein M885DRAFT_325481 [Pelagophyceae sp. CCMP2097]
MASHSPHSHRGSSLIQAPFVSVASHSADDGVGVFKGTVSFGRRWSLGLYACLSAPRGRDLGLDVFGRRVGPVFGRRVGPVFGRRVGPVFGRRVGPFLRETGGQRRPLKEPNVFQGTSSGRLGADRTRGCIRTRAPWPPSRAAHFEPLSTALYGDCRPGRPSMRIRPTLPRFGRRIRPNLIRFKDRLRGEPTLLPERRLKKAMRSDSLNSALCLQGLSCATRGPYRKHKRSLPPKLLLAFSKTQFETARSPSNSPPKRNRPVQKRPRNKGGRWTQVQNLRRTSARK